MNPYGLKVAYSASHINDYWDLQDTDRLYRNNRNSRMAYICEDGKIKCWGFEDEKEVEQESSIPSKCSIREKVAMALTYVALGLALVIAIPISFVACIIAAIFCPDVFNDYEEDL